MATVTLTSGADFGLGTVGDDTIYANAGPGSGPIDGADLVFALGGNDLVFGAAGNDTVNGGAGNDTVFGGDDNDKILGGAGDDAVYGDSGNDFVDGSDGDDKVFGGAGDDTISGSFGNDTLFGGSGADTLVFRKDQGDDAMNGVNFEDGDKIILGQFGLKAAQIVDSLDDIHALEDSGFLTAEVQQDNLVLEISNGQVLRLWGLGEEYTDLPV